MNINFYVSKEEKEALQLLADMEGKSLSEYIHEKLMPYIHNRLSEYDTFMNYDYTKQFEPRTRDVRLKITEKEYQILMSQAKGIHLATYIRYLLFQCQKPVSIEIYSEDIEFLCMRVSDYHVQLQNFISALYLRNELCDSDRKRLLEIARSTQLALRDVASITRANRNAIRSNGTR